MRLLICPVLLLCLGGNAQRPSYGGKLKPEQANIDVRHYTIDLKVDSDPYLYDDRRQ